MPTIRRFFTGNSTQNDSYIGPAGKISFDIEKKNVRVHDGVTPGGHEIAEIRDVDAAVRLIEYTEILSGNIDGQDVTHRVGSSYGWRDMMGEIKIMGQGSSSPSWAPFADGVMAYEFSGAKMNEAWLTFHVGHDYALGTQLYPHLHWTPSSDAIGTVRWGFEYTIAKGHGQGGYSRFPPTQIVYVEHAVDTQQRIHLVSEVSDIDGIAPDNAEPDSVVMMRVFRDAEHVNDTYPDSVNVLAGALHYQISRLATRNKTPDFFD